MGTLGRQGMDPRALGGEDGGLVSETDQCVIRNQTTDTVTKRTRRNDGEKEGGREIKEGREESSWENMAVLRRKKMKRENEESWF